MANTLSNIVGSVDWGGARAPAGGTHTGQCTITMQDGTQFVVAHNVAEVQQRRDQHASAQTTPPWCSFDQPGRATPVILDLSLIKSIA